MNKILIVNFGAFGDIINSTPIAKHFKIKYPNCEVSWLTRKKYNSVLKNNVNVDKILLINEDDMDNVNNVLLSHSTKLSIFNFFSEYKVIFAAPYMSHKYDGTPRSNLLDIIKNETSTILDWECDFIPNIFLSEDEKKEALLFYNDLKTENKNILVEYESFSSQTDFNLDYIHSLCKKIDGLNYNIIFSGIHSPPYFDLLKSKYNVNFYHYSGSFLSNAELYNLIDIFIGVNSGITCLTSSDYCVNNKIRIEVSRGEHWSSVSWTHNKENKFICYSKQDYINSLNKVFIS